MFIALTGMLPTQQFIQIISLLRLRPLYLVLYLLPLSPLQATSQSIPSTSLKPIVGNWIIDTPERISLLQLNPNQSYLHIEFNLLAPHQSVAEWGRLAIAPNSVRFIASYTNNPREGFVAHHFTHPTHQMTLTKSNTTLLLDVDSNADSVTDKQYRYNRNTTHPVYGVWHQLSTPALSSLVLLNNGYYATVHINLHQDPHTDAHITHLQWGRFEGLQGFGEPIFDSHPQLTLNPVNAITRVIYHPQSQQLALSFDQDIDHTTDHLPLFKQ
ncbi:hypothetical protein K8B83_00725 [Shewanella inventionis]|uniref:DUF3108 domain-containing protein n=1 Tax=Shewanella inventionis TaxID=1738770 RepID=A0ABQ1IKV1_9GAMM|nr:hypothetical protein [Shewanella inventionis]MCL1156430.1 hypothetical protein [Shewanella inventionis]UAL43451.1 hypothetical protein K8B83_00725 [Shewanella inventionis]GGB45475.1 hypothetical protein GCM10011607_01910 [Shewanella inventionis]